MSIVSNYTNRDMSARIRRERRVATVCSLVISLLVVTLLGVILALYLLPALNLGGGDPVVAYSVKEEKEEKVDSPEVTRQVQRQTSAPSQSLAKVITASVDSPVAIPVPDVVVDSPSADFGNDGDFGDGWGSGGSGDGMGGTTFFGQSVKSERIAYVIDFSASMKKKKGEKNGREGLMRNELIKSLNQLHPSTKFAMIFFAGPAWVAGDEVRMIKGKKEAEVTGKGGHKFKWESNGSAHAWEPKGAKREVPDWLQADNKQLRKSKKVVEDTRLVFGTNWQNPLEMALAMDPLPQVIYFMTDGAARGSDVWAKEIGQEARKKNVIINCIAMMQPRAEKDMNDLAKRAKGQFTMVLKDGKIKKVR